MSIEELIKAEAEAAEQNMDAPLKVGSRVTRGHRRSRTLQVRLNDEELAALVHVAEARGIPVSTLARDVLLTQLASPADAPKVVIARMRADLDALATSVA